MTGNGCSRISTGTDQSDGQECGGGRNTMGRRRQGQDRRLAYRSRRRSRPLSGRAQCRAHAGRRRTGVQAEPGAVGNRSPGRRVLHRQRRRPRHPPSAERDPAPRSRRHRRPRTSPDQPRLPAHPQLPRRARQRARSRPLRRPAHRYHRQGNRSGLRRQGRPARAAGL
ncbi:MAG: hypothetical protein AW07_04554 [Candidatus Accumulibacter sp. SK-11]|nr:MAG: hypothetical protein AW07_04554 [Candidatus Accumulibacter sp. SK-11]